MSISDKLSWPYRVSQNYQDTDFDVKLFFSYQLLYRLITNGLFLYESIAQLSMIIQGVPELFFMVIQGVPALFGHRTLLKTSELSQVS